MKIQKGRSLIEMLGVLAIMGLIGLTAFEGFESVMRRNTTENIWKELLLRASDLASKPTGATHFGAGFNNAAFGVNWNIVQEHNIPSDCINALAHHTTLIGISISMPDDAVRDALIEKARLEDSARADHLGGVHIADMRKLNCVYVLAPGIPASNLLDNNQPIPQNADNMLFVFRKSR